MGAIAAASGVTEDAVSHLDLAENELPSLDGLATEGFAISDAVSHEVLRCYDVVELMGTGDGGGENEGRRDA